MLVYPPLLFQVARAVNAWDPSGVRPLPFLLLTQGGVPSRPIPGFRSVFITIEIRCHFSFFKVIVVNTAQTPLHRTYFIHKKPKAHFCLRPINLILFSSVYFSRHAGYLQTAHPPVSANSCQFLSPQDAFPWISSAASLSPLRRASPRILLSVSA